MMYECEVVLGECFSGRDPSDTDYLFNLDLICTAHYEITDSDLFAEKMSRKGRLESSYNRLAENHGIDASEVTERAIDTFNAITENDILAYAFKIEKNVFYSDGIAMEKAREMLKIPESVDVIKSNIVRESLINHYQDAGMEPHVAEFIGNIASNEFARDDSPEVKLENKVTCYVFEKLSNASDVFCESVKDSDLTPLEKMRTVENNPSVVMKYVRVEEDALHNIGVTIKGVSDPTTKVTKMYWPKKS